MKTMKLKRYGYPAIAFLIGFLFATQVGAQVFDESFGQSGITELNENVVVFSSSLIRNRTTRREYNEFVLNWKTGGIAVVFPEFAG